MKISILRRKIKYWRFIISAPTYFSGHLPDDSSSILLLTIAFNEASLIEQQIRLLKKNFQDPFNLFVVDNSTDLLVREKIQDICQTYQVGYCGVPLANPYIENKSHAAAMHWAYFQLVRKSKAKYFGFLDHDIFPLAPYSLKGKWVQGIYGRVIHAYSKTGYQEKISQQIPYWSLWAGFCFFEKDRISGIFPWSLNFFSKHFRGGYFLDTGGGLWDSLYSKMPYPSNLATYEVKPFSDQGEGIQNQNYELLDETWIHFVSLSNWRSITAFEKKKETLEEMLRLALSLP